MATVSRRMARTDPQRRAVGELQLDDAVTPGDGLPVHQLDRDDGQRSAIDAVDEIADFQIGDRPIADGRRDRRRRRGAVAVRAAGGARPVDRLVAPRHRRAERHRAADLRAGAATSSAAGHPEVARRPRRRVARRAPTRAVGAVGAGPGAGVAAASAIEDVVAGVDAEAAAAFESLAVGVALTGLPRRRSPPSAARSRRGRPYPAVPPRPADPPTSAAACRSGGTAASGRVAPPSRAATSAVRSAGSAESTAGSATAARARASTGSTPGLTADATAGSTTAAATTRIGSTRLNRSASAQREGSEHDHHMRDELHRGPLLSQMNRSRR